jgi:hypothetical protein
MKVIKDEYVHSYYVMSTEVPSLGHFKATYDVVLNNEGKVHNVFNEYNSIEKNSEVFYYFSNKYNGKS